MLVIFKSLHTVKNSVWVLFKIECRVNERVGSFIQHIKYLIVVRYCIYIDGENDSYEVCGSVLVAKRLVISYNRTNK